jgi:hypothetical protein
MPMIKRWLFWLSYRFLQLTIISFVPFSLVVHLQGWNLLLYAGGTLALGGLALSYLMSYRCIHCDRLIYSEEHLEKLKYKSGFPLPHVEACPHCESTAP